MKKRNLLFALPLMGMALSGCTVPKWLGFLSFLPFIDVAGEDGNYTIQPKIEGGTAEERTAILEAINFKPICYPSGNPSTTIYPDTGYTLKEDDGDNVYLVKKQKIKDKTVEIEWKIDTNQDYYAGRDVVDEYRDLVEVEYQGYGEPDGQLKWAISKISCGGASATNAKELEYTCATKNFTYRHDLMSIADINKVTEEEKTVNLGADKAVYKFKSTLDIMDYEPEAGQKYSPYFAGNNEGAEEDYLYVGVKGKVIYLAPDGNWGLLADGDQVLEIYAGAGTKLKPENFPNLANEYVCAWGNISQYLGNVQLSFISKFTKINANEITEPTMNYATLTESKIAGLKNPTSEGYSSHKQFIDGFSNSLGKVTGTFVAGSLKDRDGKTVASWDKLVDNRFTFELKVGSENMTIAYDYHTNIGAKKNLFNEYVSVLKAGGNIQVKGTLRYNGSDTFPFLSLAYEPASISDAEDFNDLKEAGAYICTRSGDTFSPASSYVSGTKYYVRSDRNSGAVWNIVPCVSGDIAKVS